MTSSYGSSCTNDGKGALNTPETPPKRYSYNMTSSYGSSCANNGKGALDTPETPPERYSYNMTSSYGSSCTNNGKGALNTHRSPSPFLTALSSSPLSPTSLPFGPASITRISLMYITSFYGSSCANNGKDALHTIGVSLPLC